MCITRKTYNACYHQETELKGRCACEKTPIQFKLIFGRCPRCESKDNTGWLPPKIPNQEWPTNAANAALARLLTDKRKITPEAREDLVTDIVRVQPQLKDLLGNEEPERLVHFPLGYDGYNYPPEYEHVESKMNGLLYNERIQVENAELELAKNIASDKFWDHVKSEGGKVTFNSRRWDRDPGQEHIITPHQWRVCAYRDIGAMSVENCRKMNDKESDAMISRKLIELEKGYDVEMNGRAYRGGYPFRLSVGRKNKFFDGRRYHPIEEAYPMRPTMIRQLSRGPPPDVEWEKDSEVGSVAAKEEMEADKSGPKPIKTFPFELEMKTTSKLKAGIIYDRHQEQHLRYLAPSNPDGPIYDPERAIGPEEICPVKNGSSSRDPAQEATIDETASKQRPSIKREHTQPIPVQKKNEEEGSKNTFVIEHSAPIPIPQRSCMSRASRIAQIEQETQFPTYHRPRSKSAESKKSVRFADEDTVIKIDADSAVDTSIKLQQENKDRELSKTKKSPTKEEHRKFPKTPKVIEQISKKVEPATQAQSVECTSMGKVSIDPMKVRKRRRSSCGTCDILPSIPKVDDNEIKAATEDTAKIVNIETAPETPTKKAPETPTKKAPEPPIKKSPDTPTKSILSTPTKKAPETPTKKPRKHESSPSRSASKFESARDISTKENTLRNRSNSASSYTSAMINTVFAKEDLDGLDMGNMASFPDRPNLDHPFAEYGTLSAISGVRDVTSAKNPTTVPVTSASAPQTPPSTPTRKALTQPPSTPRKSLTQSPFLQRILNFTGGHRPTDTDTDTTNIDNTNENINTDNNNNKADTSDENNNVNDSGDPICRHRRGSSFSKYAMKSVTNLVKNIGKHGRTKSMSSQITANSSIYHLENDPGMNNHQQQQQQQPRGVQVGGC